MEVNNFCRLCLECTPTENVVSLNDNYVENMIKVFFVDLEIELFERPVICQGCLTILKNAYDLHKTLIENGMKIEPDNGKLVWKQLGSDMCQVCLSILIDYDDNPKTINTETLLSFLSNAMPKDAGPFNGNPTICEGCIRKVQNVNELFEKITSFQAKIIAFCVKNHLTVVTNTILTLICKYIKSDNFDEFLNNNCTLPDDEIISETELVTIKKEVPIAETENKCKTLKKPTRKNVTPRKVVRKTSSSKKCTITDVIEAVVKNETQQIQKKQTEIENQQREEETLDENEENLITSGIKIENEHSKQLFVSVERLQSDDTSGENMQVVVICGEQELVVEVVKIANVYFYKCPLCFQSVKRIAVHMTHYHPVSYQKMLYKCTLCPYKTSTKGDLKVGHALVHKTGKDALKYKCSQCTYETKRKPHLERHILALHTENLPEFKCSQCNYKTHLQEYLVGHMHIHRKIPDENMFKCDQCLYTTFRRKHLKRHMLIHKDKDEIATFKCTHCKYKTYEKSHLKLHIQCMHSTPENTIWYDCEFCEYKTKYKNYLHRHKKQIHLDKSDLPVFRCNDCPYTAKNKAYLKNHINYSHRGPTFHVCTQCEFRTKCLSYFNRHVLEKHSKIENLKKLRCNICGFDCLLKSQLKRHLRLHEPEKRYLCMFCSADYKHKGDWMRHMKKHEDKKIKVDE